MSLSVASQLLQARVMSKVLEIVFSKKYFRKHLPSFFDFSESNALGIMSRKPHSETNIADQVIKENREFWTSRPPVLRSP